MNKILTNCNQVQILRDEKKVLDSRYNLIDEQKCCPKYYFADSNGIRLSSSYYSIKPLSDGTHYTVAELDFMYSLGLESWNDMHDSKCADDINYFKFHYGVVSVINGKVTEVVPVVYNDIYETNSNIVFITCDEKIKVSYLEGGAISLDKIRSKIGCVNLDINSESYGMNIAPPIMDTICDFSLEYEDFARASISGYEGFLSKEINVDNYTEFLNLYLNLKKGIISPKEYLANMKETAAKILISEQDVKSMLSEPKKKLKS